MSSTRPDSDARWRGAAAWLGREGFVVDGVEPLQGDLSPRLYARVALGSGSLILALYPTEIRDVAERFATTTELLASVGVRVPRILAFDRAAGRMAIEDLGPFTLAEAALDWREREPYYRAAFAAARRIAELSPSSVAALGSAPLDPALLRRELTQTVDKYLVPTGLVGTPADRAELEGALDILTALLGGEVAVPCHRDLMPRNLIPLASAAVGVLDHQDLRLGPPAYDAASLLNDTLFPSAERERGWLAEMGGLDRDSASYTRAVAQRALKAVGTFAAFAERGATRHLPLIPPTLERGLNALLALPETAASARRLELSWRAAISR